MRQDSTCRRSDWLVLLFVVLPIQAQAQGQIPQLFPANNAIDVNPDTQLVLSFASPPIIGKSGLIRVYGVSDNSLVDTLDMSIPASPYPTGRAPQSTEAERRAFAAANKMTDYQVNTVGGVDFHFFPIIVRGNRATLYPHNNRLKYGREYRVHIDAGVLQTAQGHFAGVDWKFRTKPASPPATTERVVDRKSVV